MSSGSHSLAEAYSPWGKQELLPRPVSIPSALPSELGGDLGSASSSTFVPALDFDPSRDDYSNREDHPCLEIRFPNAERGFPRGR